MEDKKKTFLTIAYQCNVYLSRMLKPTIQSLEIVAMAKSLFEQRLIHPSERLYDARRRRRLEQGTWNQAANLACCTTLSVLRGQFTCIQNAPVAFYPRLRAGVWGPHADSPPTAKQKFPTMYCIEAVSYGSSGSCDGFGASGENLN